MRYLSRFLLPLLLLAGALAAWFGASALGETERSARSGTTTDSAETPFTSVRRVPEFATASQESEALAAALATLPVDPGGLSCATILVDGRPVFDVRSDRPLAPAYAQLLITGHTAIDMLGPEFRYETKVMAEELADSNGRFFSDLYLVGGGDPVLMTFNYAQGFRPTPATRTPIEDLAVQIAQDGVLRIDGGIIAIERRYDTQRRLPGWPLEYTSSGVVGPLSAVQVDDGFAERAAANGGVAVPAEDPAAAAASTLAELLRAQDIDIRGTGRSVADDVELPELVPVATINSAPLAEIVLQTLATNDATAAELIMKELGLTGSGVGSIQAGGQVVQNFLQRQGIVVDLPFRDGSGIDPIGGTSCDQLAATADGIAADHPTLAVLPKLTLPAVFDGRLGDVELTSDLRVVGGAVGDASGLVGRTVDQGRRITIASIINRPGGPSESDLAFQEALVEIVDDLRLSITVEAIEIAE